MLVRYISFYIAVIVIEAQACDEPADCGQNKKHCTTREKFREKCPCTCAPDISFAKCCANQPFEHDECRSAFCSYDVSAKKQRKFKPLAVKCFDDFFKMQYCLSNGYKSYGECCLKNGIAEDTPDTPGCNIFCEGKMPPCKEMFNYWKCSLGEQFVKSVTCARDNYDHQRWVPNYTEIRKCT